MMQSPSIVICPAASAQAVLNFQTSVAKPVKVDREMLMRAGIPSERELRFWATSLKMRDEWAKTRPDDVLVFVKNKEVFSYARCVQTAESAAIAQLVWRSPEWSLLFLLEQPRSVSIPVARLSSALGYSPKYGFRPLRTLGSAESRPVIALLALG